MKMKLAVASALLVGAFAFTMPSSAAPLAGAGVATKAATADAKVTEEVRHRRHWRHRRWHHRRWHHRRWHHRRWYRPYYYRPYYGGFYGGYPWGWRRPGIYLRFGW